MEQLAQQPDSIRKPAGLAEVARLAGVSLRTVSRALHSPDLVSEATRRRIEQVSAAIGYVPDLVARSLVSQRSRVIAALVPPITDTVFIDTIHALSEGVASHGYQLLVGHLGFHSRTEAEFVAAFLGRRPDAIVLTGVTHSDEARRLLQRAAIPVVEIWNLTEDPIDMLVGFSNYGASRALTHRLWSLGCRRIAFVTRPAAHSDRARDRRRGYLQALHELGAPADPDMMLEVASGLQDGVNATRALRSRPYPPDAIVLTGESLAAGALLELLSAGVRVPDEIRVAGFGELASLTSTPMGLVSVRIDGRRIGREAAELLIGRLSNADARHERITDVGFDVLEDRRP